MGIRMIWLTLFCRFPEDDYVTKKKHFWFGMSDEIEVENKWPFSDFFFVYFILGEIFRLPPNDVLLSFVAIYMHKYNMWAAAISFCVVYI